MSLLPVDDAVARLLSGVAPLAAEEVSLAEAAGRVLGSDLAARRTQPPFPASAMDGYAVRAGEASTGRRLQVVGESRAGRRFAGQVWPGDAVRIFTGAPVPDGADAILIQENAQREGDGVVAVEPPESGQFIRPAGLDFRSGDVLLHAGRLFDSRALALAAASGHGSVPVRRQPRVAILSTGDELVPPGTEPGPDQIVSSNGVGLAAFVRECGGVPIDLGIAPDQVEAIGERVDRAGAADVLVVIGGASVGDHDLVQPALAGKGMMLDFWRIAMRPGKPLMVGRLGDLRVLGLPGNPVSALVCAYVFLRPLLRAFLGLPTAARISRARLGVALGQNDRRQEYIRARLSTEGGERIVTPFPFQDSSMLSALAMADALIIRPVNAPAVAAGALVPVLLLGHEFCSDDEIFAGLAEQPGNG